LLSPQVNAGLLQAAVRPLPRIGDCRCSTSPRLRRGNPGGGEYVQGLRDPVWRVAWFLVLVYFFVKTCLTQEEMAVLISGLMSCLPSQCIASSNIKRRAESHGRFFGM